MEPSEHPYPPGCGWTLAAYPAAPPEGAPQGGWRLRVTRAPNLPAPLVSVVTVVRNGAKTLGRAAESVLTQDYPNLEYIVIDGGSTDGTLDLITDMDCRIAVWVSGQDAGISDAFNKGIALTRGDIIGLLNSDDWYEPGAIRAVVQAMQESGADIAYGHFAKWSGDRRALFRTGDAGALEAAMILSHATVFVRRACYERFGLFRLDFQLAMDYEWLLRAKTGGARFSLVDMCIANIEGGGIGDRRWRRGQVEVAKARAMHLAHARSRVAYFRYLSWAILVITLRRAYHRFGLHQLRQWLRRGNPGKGISDASP